MNIFLTLDYELFFGNNCGTQEKSIVSPTKRLLEVLNKYGVKASFFVDAGYLLKLKEFRKSNSTLELDYQALFKQLMLLSETGHDIQLHIHPHWEDSYFEGATWVIDTSRYKIHDFSYEEVDGLVRRYKQVLTDLIDKEPFAYRAGGWCIQPFTHLKSALKLNNIWLDSTLYQNGKNNSATHYFNFKGMPDKSLWRFEDDPLHETEHGYFTEIPISSYRVSPLFFWKMVFYKKLGSGKHKSFGDGSGVGGSGLDKLRMLTRFTNSVVSVDGYKASYLQAAYRQFLKKCDHENFVIIGHPKAMSEYSLEKLEQFIKLNISNNFTTFSNAFGV
ncbi:MAG: hypothetical protein P8163_15385 [Candidatus Thiodiazotropha sp.]